MPVFKMYFKSVKSHKLICILYTSIFLFVFLIFSNLARNDKQVNAFSATRVSFALEDRDHSELSKSLSDYLAKEHDLIEMDYDDDTIKDALFFENLQVFIRIPEHFEKDMQAGRIPKVYLEQKPDYAMGALLQQQMNTYLNEIHSYLVVQPNASLSDILHAVAQDMSKEVEVQMVNSQDVVSKVVGMSMYFDYLAYIILSLIVVIIGTILTNIYQQAIRMRNLISPMRNISFHLQLFAAMILSSFCLWGIMMVALQCMIPDVLFSEQGLYFIVNSIIFLFVCISITYFIANLLAGSDKAEEKVNGIANVLCLGMCFLGGVFIPQALLSESVKLIGSFFPTFWYMKAVNAITAIQEFSGDALMEILYCFGIQILFVIAFFVASVYVAHLKTSSRSIHTNDLGENHL